MAFREVTVIEVKEVLRQWLAGAGKKRIAARIGLDPKTVRRYVHAAQACGLALGCVVLTDELIAAVVAELSGASPREHGEAWHACVAQRPFLEQMLGKGVRLSKVRRLLLRQGVTVPYSTLHRFAAVELGFGRRAVTLPVADGELGEELQVDTGWMTLLEPDGSGRRRRFRAWLFTPSVSRYRHDPTRAQDHAPPPETRAFARYIARPAHARPPAEDASPGLSPARARRRDQSPRQHRDDAARRPRPPR